VGHAIRPRSLTTTGTTFFLVAFEGTSAQTAAPVTSQLAGVSTVPLATPSTQPGRPAIGVGYVKRKYEVNEADREAVKKVSLGLGR
jgi:hypothetical protein